MGLLEFGLGKPIRMDIRPGFLKGIPVEIFLADKMATHRGWNVGRRGFFVQRSLSRLICSEWIPAFFNL